MSLYKDTCKVEVKEDEFGTYTITLTLEVHKPTTQKKITRVQKGKDLLFFTRKDFIYVKINEDTNEILSYQPFYYDGDEIIKPSKQYKLEEMSPSALC